MRTALYRLYDTSDVLLYVGITSYPPTRFGAHAKISPWWPEVAARHIEWLPDRRTAERAERAAIRSEAPVYNVAQSPAHPARYGACRACGQRKFVTRRNVITAKHAPCSGAGLPPAMEVGR